MYVPSAFAAAGPTLKATRVGQTIIWRGKKYTAIKQGKKILWNKGTPVVAPPKVDPTPTPSATTTATKAPLMKEEIALANSGELVIGETKIFTKGKSYVISRTSSGLRAFDATCTHNGCTIDLKGKQLICPCHLAEFDLESGSALKGPATRSLEIYECRDLEGKIVVLDYPW